MFEVVLHELAGTSPALGGRLGPWAVPQYNNTIAFLGGGNAESKLPVSEIVPLPESPAAVPYPGGDRAGGAGLIGLALFVMARAAVE